MAKFIIDNKKIPTHKKYTKNCSDSHKNKTNALLPIQLHLVWHTSNHASLIIRVFPFRAVTNPALFRKSQREFYRGGGAPAATIFRPTRDMRT